MFAARSALLFALLPVFAGCQMLGSKPESSVSKAGWVRMQGNLTGEGGKLLFQPCNEQRRFVVNDGGNTGILQESAALADKSGKVFADLRGSFVAGKAANSDHHPFSEEGVPAVFIYSNGGKGYYHDVFDKPASLSFTLIPQVARLLQDFIPQLCGTR